MSIYSRRSGIMLAYPYLRARLERDASKRVPLWKPPFFVQPKLNGNRSRLILGSDQAIMLSSEENLVRSCPHIIHQAREAGLRGIELDGEVYVHGLNKQRLDSMFGRTVNLHPEYQTQEFHVFDLVCDGSQLQRLELLKKHVPETLSIKIVPTHICFTVKEVEDLLVSYMQQGYEGIVIRDSYAPYVTKRTTTMMKWKPRKRDSYKIVGVTQECSVEGELKDSLGAFVCQSDEDETFNVGSGPILTKENREHYWRIQDEIIGMYLTVRYPELTERGVPCHAVAYELTLGREDFDEDEDYFCS